jgi:hypothetical protein
LLTGRWESEFELGVIHIVRKRGASFVIEACWDIGAEGDRSLTRGSTYVSIQGEVVVNSTPWQLFQLQWRYIKEVTLDNFGVWTPLNS